MYMPRNVKNCPTYRPMAHDIPMSYRRTNSMGCRGCAYLGSSHCSMDIADSIEPPLDIFR